MGFADQYLLKQKIKSINIKDDPNIDLLYTVVIPCYNEPGILDCIKSLHNCEMPLKAIEIIVVVNTPANANKMVARQNEKSYYDLLEQSKNLNTQRFKIHPVLLNHIPNKNAGAGYARKAGMNEAIKRFNIIDRPGGIILSLDADAVCDVNYFTAIEEHLNKYPETNGFSVYFEHPLQGNDYPRVVYEGITFYELDLRYFIEGLRYAGFPYAYHTIGSCFGVKASAYIKQGGMNMRQGGEDFYFLHKIIPMGHYYEVNKTKVMPSPRPSNRVPFGTGPWIDKFVKRNDKQIFTYNISAFDDIKYILSSYKSLFHATLQKIQQYIEGASKPMQAFLLNNRFEDAILEINANCAGEEAFSRKFLSWFDAFRIVKYMHFSHDGYYQKQYISDAANNLLQVRYNTIPLPRNTAELLEIYRIKQRS